MADYVYLAGFIKNGLFMLPEMSTLFFPPASSIHSQDAYINSTCNLHFYTRMEHLSLGMSNRVC